MLEVLKFYLLEFDSKIHVKKKTLHFFLILEYIYVRLINRIKGGVRDEFP